MVGHYRGRCAGGRGGDGGYRDKQGAGHYQPAVTQCRPAAGQSQRCVEVNDGRQRRYHLEQRLDPRIGLDRPAGRAEFRTVEPERSCAGWLGANLAAAGQRPTA